MCICCSGLYSYHDFGNYFSKKIKRKKLFLCNKHFVRDGDRVKKASAYYEPGLLDMPISIQLSYKGLETRDGSQVSMTIIENFELGLSQPISTQKIWKKFIEVNDPRNGNSQGQRVVTQTEYYELGQLIYVQHEWKNMENINGAQTPVTYKITYEGAIFLVDPTTGELTDVIDFSNAIKTAQRVYKERKEVNDPVTGVSLGEKIVTHIENYEVGQKMSDQYIWRNKEAGRSGEPRLVTYVVTYEFGMTQATSIQKSYYDKLNDYIPEGNNPNPPLKVIKVVENYEFGISSPVSVKYIYYDERNISSDPSSPERRLVQVTENRIPLDGTEFVESVQYVYKELKSSIYTKDGRIIQDRVVTVIKTYEGQFTAGVSGASVFLTGVQWEYSVIDDGKVKKVTAYFEPGLDQPVSIQYTYRTIDTRAGTSKLITIIDTYENYIHIATQKIWKNPESVVDPVTGKVQGSKVVTYRENYELGLLVSIERTWKYYDDTAQKIITYTEIYEGSIESGELQDIDGIHLANSTTIFHTSTQKAYKEIYKDRLATIVETYELGFQNPTNIQKMTQLSYLTNLAMKCLKTVLRDIQHIRLSKF